MVRLYGAQLVNGARAALFGQGQVGWQHGDADVERMGIEWDWRLSARACAGWQPFGAEVMQ